jgi:hypothetical protein
VKRSVLSSPAGAAKRRRGRGPSAGRAPKARRMPPPNAAASRRRAVQGPRPLRSLRDLRPGMTRVESADALPSPWWLVDAHIPESERVRATLGLSFPVGEGVAPRSGVTDGARRRRVPRSGSKWRRPARPSISASPNARAARPIRLGFAETPSPTGKEKGRRARRPHQDGLSPPLDSQGRRVNRLALVARGRGCGACGTVSAAAKRRLPRSRVARLHMARAPS